MALTWDVGGGGARWTPDANQSVQSGGFTDPSQAYKALSQSIFEGAQGTPHSEDVSTHPQFATLSPEMQKQVKDIQTADFATRNDNGLGAFLTALALPSAVAIGLPALASGGTDWGIGSGLAANYAGAGAGAGGAISGVEGAIPGSIGYNVPLSAGDIAAYQGAALNPAATITAKDLGLAGAITGAGAAGSAGGAPAVTNAGVPSIASTTPTGAAGTTGAGALR